MVLGSFKMFLTTKKNRTTAQTEETKLAEETNPDGNKEKGHQSSLPKVWAKSYIGDASRMETIQILGTGM